MIEPLMCWFHLWSIEDLIKSKVTFNKICCLGCYQLVSKLPHEIDYLCFIIDGMEQKINISLNPTSQS